MIPIRHESGVNWRTGEIDTGIEGGGLGQETRVEAGRLELSPKKTAKEQNFVRGMSREPVLKVQKTVMIAAAGGLLGRRWRLGPEQGG
jgi:hypothetical protein